MLNLDELLNASPKRVATRPCIIGKWLGDLPVNDSIALQEMIDDPAWSPYTLYNEWYVKGFRVAGRSAFERHMKKLCGCYA